MKKIVLIILALSILGGTVILIHYNKKNIDNENLSINNSTSDNISNNNVTENDDNTKIENEVQDNGSNLDSSNVNSDVKESSFKIKKIEQKDFNNNYTIENQYEIITKDYFKLEQQNDDFVISIIKSEANKNLLQNEGVIKYNEKYIISNIKVKDVNSIFYGVEGQDAGYPLVYILQNDGTVKGINTEFGYKTGKFVAENISGLNDIKKIEQASVTPPDDSGYVAVIAITKDNNVYEIRKQ